MSKNRVHLLPRSRAKATPQQPERLIVHSSLYLPEGVYEALRKIAFEERRKIHDLVLEGVDAILQKRGYPTVETLKTKFTTRA